jgi:AcrR family transcriptional regulator
MGDNAPEAAVLAPQVAASLPPDAPDEVDEPRTTPAEEVGHLVSATWAVAARIGSFEPSVRDILQEAGMSTKAFYRHFRSKDDLLLVALEAGSQRLTDYIEGKMAAYPDPLPRIRVWIEGFVRQAAVPSAARRTLPWTLGAVRLAAAHPEAFDRSQALVIAPLTREIARAAAEGSAHSPQPAKDARIIYGYTMDALRHHLVRGTEPGKGTARQLVDFTYRALSATPPD